MDIDDFILHSDFPPDKIVALGEVNIVNDGVTSEMLYMKIVEHRIPNPYIRKTFVRYVWSVESGIKAGQESPILYTFSYSEIPPLSPLSGEVTGIRGMVSVGVNDDEIIFRTGSGYHGAVTWNGSNLNYTPISQTFNIKYALFEME